MDGGASDVGGFVMDGSGAVGACEAGASDIGGFVMDGSGAVGACGAGASDVDSAAVYGGAPLQVGKGRNGTITVETFVDPERQSCPKLKRFLSPRRLTEVRDVHWERNRSRTLVTLSRPRVSIDLSPVL